VPRKRCRALSLVVRCRAKETLPCAFVAAMRPGAFAMHRALPWAEALPCVRLHPLPCARRATRTAKALPTHLPGTRMHRYVTRGAFAVCMRTAKRPNDPRSAVCSETLIYVGGDEDVE
jgi:hypothetical protein